MEAELAASRSRVAELEAALRSSQHRVLTVDGAAFLAAAAHLGCAVAEARGKLSFWERETEGMGSPAARAAVLGALQRCVTTADAVAIAALQL